MNQFSNLQSESADSYLAQVTCEELDSSDYQAKYLADYHDSLDEQGD